MCGNKTIARWRFFVVIAIFIAASPPARAHHQAQRAGGTVGIGVPAITHGEMMVIAKYRDQIVEVAARQPVTDPTLRLLTGFINLQYFACFWGLVPGSLTDEGSPFNECSHAYLAGARALLRHVAVMPGDQSLAKGLEARIAEELASDPTFGVLCSNSTEVFDSGVIVGPDWRLAATHLPSALTLSLFATAIAAGLFRVVAHLSRLRSSAGSGKA